MRDFANHERVTTQWVRHHYFNNPKQSTRSRIFLHSKDKIEFSHRAAGNNWIIMFALLSFTPTLPPSGTVEDGSTDHGFVTRSCDPPRSFVRILIQPTVPPVLSWPPDTFLRQPRWFVWWQWEGRRRPLELVTVIKSDHQKLNVQLNHHDHNATIYDTYREYRNS